MAEPVRRSAILLASVIGLRNGVRGRTDLSTGAEDEGFVLLAADPEIDTALQFEHLFFPILFAFAFACYGVLLLRYVKLNFPGSLTHSIRTFDSSLYCSPKPASILLSMLSMCLFALCWIGSISHARDILTPGKSALMITGYACLLLAYMVQAPRYLYVVQLTPQDHEVTRRAWLIYLINFAHVGGLVAALVLLNHRGLVYSITALSTSALTVGRFSAALCVGKRKKHPKLKNGKGGKKHDQAIHESDEIGAGYNSAALADRERWEGDVLEGDEQYRASEQRDFGVENFDDEDFNFELVSNCDVAAFIACVALLGFLSWACLMLFDVDMQNDLYLANLRNHSLVAICFQIALFGFIKKRKILENKTNRFFE